MLIEAISLRGYCRTFRPPKPASLGKRIGNTAFDPAMRITKLTTIASTGRLMKRSVNDFIYKFEIRISKSEKIRIPKFKLPRSLAARPIDGNFFIRDCFEFRYSCFGFSV